jgi:hypothetical protein
MNRIIVALAFFALAGSANAQQALTPQWDTHAQHKREVQSKLARCMVDLTTIADPELRKWCEAQSRRLP